MLRERTLSESKLPWSTVRVDHKSHKLRNSIYNNLDIPSFLYDLLTIYFIIKNDYSIDKLSDLVNSMTTYNKDYVVKADSSASFKPWGLYDINTIAKFLNDKLSRLINYDRVISL